MIIAHISNEKVMSSSIEAFALLDKSSFGEKKSGRVEYATFEALYLLQENKIQIKTKKGNLTLKELIKKFKKNDKKIENKLAVYTDLRKKGYLPKTALKYGAEFRVYNKGIKPGQSHAKWILFTSTENEKLAWHDFAAKNRVAHSTKKNLLIAIVDEEGDILYYEVSWIKP
jgi:tRNA-intron endonuclease, archaea type